MCRVLVRWKEKPRTLRQDWKHESTLSKRGDPIVVMDDGHVWGREEGLPNYVSLDIEGMPKEEWYPFLKPDKSQLIRPDGKPYWMHKHAYNIDLESLPRLVIDGLRRDGFAPVSWADLSGHIVHKRTQLTR